MIAKVNVRIGLEWRFGPEWPGQKCGAKTRSGSPCQRPADKQKGRCRLHGGASIGPKTNEGQAIIAKSNIKHGHYTKDKLAQRKKEAMIAKELRARRKMIEIRLRYAGIIDRWSCSNSLVSAIPAFAVPPALLKCSPISE